ncbi:hypothetical protein AVEN_65291-1 [Araneus ventricosus]|uniref:Uncharacterized protein n=1 Tax=Araneus ventricosus TaxID=182803 RepID=A0A4Y2AGJ5_ARAVE|nr:hypothetical protein AVEN_65291-1 [Araneus ventricosus]
MMAEPAQLKIPNRSNVLATAENFVTVTLTAFWAPLSTVADGTDRSRCSHICPFSLHSLFKYIELEETPDTDICLLSIPDPHTTGKQLWLPLSEADSRSKGNQCSQNSEP